MEAWITTGVRKDEADELVRIWRTNDRGHEGLAAEGYELERICGAPDSDGAWRERVLVVRSPLHAHQQTAGLENRLHHAETALTALTPPRGRGKRQITDGATLVEAIARVLKEHRVDGLLSVTWEKQVEQKTQYVGRGRGSQSREKRVIQKTRYHITHIARQEDRMADLCQRFGWKAFVTNAPRTRLSLQEAVLCSRNEYRVERIFNRLKSRVHIAPLFVKLNEQIAGLTYLLTLGVRVLTVMEFVLRRSLAQDQAGLSNMHPENKQKSTDKPTAERSLQAFAGVSLTIIEHATGEEILRRITPLSGVQEAILQRLGLDTNLYRQLEIQNMGGVIERMGRSIDKINTL
jgi:transposase